MSFPTPAPSPAPLAPAAARPPGPSLWVYLAATLAYFAVVRLGLWSASLANGFSPVWLGTGLSIWLTIRFGPRILIALAVGEFAANGLNNVPITGALAALVVATMAAGNILTAYFGAWLWQRGRDWWQRLEDFCEPVSYIVAALAAPVVAATVGVGALVLAGGKPVGEAAGQWIAWWTSDAIGALFLLPLLLAAPALGQRLRHATAREAIRGAILFGVSAVVVLAIFGRPGGGYFLFALFPVLVLATAWFGAPGAHLLAFFLGVASTFAVAINRGPLATGRVWEDLLTVQLFLSAVAVIALLLPGIHRTRNLLQPLPLALLLGGWALGGLGFGRLLVEQERTDAADFAQLANNAEAVIENRLVNYVTALHSARSFVLGAPAVTNRGWKNLVQSLNLPTNYPGLRGVGLVYPVAPEELEGFLARVRADVAPDFTLRPFQGETLSRDRPHFVLTHIERLVPAAEVLHGLDVGSQPLRRKILETARDTGQPQMAPKTSRSQQGSGFTLYLPIYALGAPTTTVAERRLALRAWVHAGFGSHELLQGVLGARRDKLHFYLFAPGPLDAEHLIYTTTAPGQALPTFALTPSRSLFGQELTLAWSRGPAFVTDSRTPLIWLAVSLALGTVLLTGWILSLQSFREGAEALVTERTQSLSESEGRLRALVEAIPDLVFEQSASGEFLSVHASDPALLLSPPETLLHRNVFDFLPPPIAAKALAGFAAAFETGQTQLINYVLTLSGRETHFEARITPCTATTVLVIVRDTTSREQAEAALRASEARARAIIEASPVPMALIDDAQKIALLNPAFIATFGYELADIPTLADWWPKAYPDPVYRQWVAEFWQRERERSAQTGTAFAPLERSIRCKDGTERFALVGAAPLEHAFAGDYLVVLHDITARKEAELALQASLADKTALLKEVHHRVKNNLQVITSLLRLESGRSGVPATKTVLTDMQGRIRAMAQLHDMLYHSGTFATVDLGSYLGQIATQSFRMLNAAPTLVRLTLELASIHVTMDQAAPCGLIVNELISNCLKHGFPAGRGGEVKIELQPVVGSTQVCLRVSDTGVGLPPDFAAKRGESLGLQLVGDLSAQLNGTLEIGPVPASIFTVMFTPTEVKIPLPT
jgi:PAS domain S-box-containing protein